MLRGWVEGTGLRVVARPAGVDHQTARRYSSSPPPNRSCVLAGWTGFHRSAGPGDVGAVPAIVQDFVGVACDS